MSAITYSVPHTALASSSSSTTSTSSSKSSNDEKRSCLPKCLGSLCGRKVKSAVVVTPALVGLALTILGIGLMLAAIATVPFCPLAAIILVSIGGTAFVVGLVAFSSFSVLAICLSKCLDRANKKDENA